MLFAELTEEEARDLARENGYEEGHREGLKAGLAEGRAEGLKEGLAEGLAEGLNRVNRLNEILIEKGRIDDLRKAIADEEYQKQLFEEFNL